MKTKKLLIIAGILILTAAIVSVGVYSANRVGGDEAEVPATEETKPIIVTKVNYPKDQKREDAEPEKNYTNIENNIENLTYAYTDNRVLSSNSDVYVDSNGNEYFFTANDTLSGYRGRVPHNINFDKVLSQDEIISLAEKYADSLLTDRFDGFILASVTYIETPSKYLIEYERKYGEGDFITGEMIDMTIYGNGHLYSCFLRNSTEMEGFEETLLDGITQEYLEDYVTKEAAELFPDLKEIWVNNIRVVKKDGKYTLQLCYNHITENYPSDEMQTKYNINVLMTMDRCEFAMNYYYPLEE